MYGWIETGGFFANTQAEDVVFRTSSSNNLLALGNADVYDSNAALYIKHNHIGLQCFPSVDKVLSVVGNSIFHDSDIKITDSINQTRLELHGKGLSFITQTGGSNLESIYLDAVDCRLVSDSIVTKNVLTKKRTLSQVYIQNIVPTTIRETVDDTLIPGHDITIDAQLGEYFLDGTVFVVRKRSYYVWSSLPTSSSELLLKISPYSSYAPTNTTVFNIGESVDIDILEEWMPLNGASRLETLSYRFVVDSFIYEDIIAGSTLDSTIVNGLLDVHFYFRNKRHELKETLDIGSYYIVSNSSVITNAIPTTILKLVEFEKYTATNGQQGFHMRFRSADGLANLESVRSVLESGFVGVPKTMYLLPLTYIPAPRIVDYEAIVGYVIDEFSGRLCYQLVNTQLAGAVSDYDRIRMLKSYAIDTVKLGDRPLKHANLFYKPFAPDTIVLDTYGVNDEVFSVARQKVTSEMRGIPIRIINFTHISDVIAAFEFTCDYKDLVIPLYTYVSHYFYWMDTFPESFIFGVNSLEKTQNDSFIVNITAQIDTIFDRPEFAMLDRIAYILPIKYTTHVRVGEQSINTYIPYSASVATHVVRETLTVKGNGSFIGDIRLFNGNDPRERDNRFVVSYNQASVFDMNGCIQVTNSNVFMKCPLELNTTVTATDYLQYSDARLKTNIRSTNSKTDLERLRNVNVRLFNFHRCKRDSKGVIAQEIQELFPEAVTTVNDVIPLIEQIAYIDPKGYLRLHIIDDTQITVGSVLRLKLNEIDKLDVKVIQVDDVSKTRPKGMDDICKKTIHAHIDNFITIADKRFIQVVGLVDNVLLVNYEVLYMSSINAIKELYSEIQTLKNSRTAS